MAPGGLITKDEVRSLLRRAVSAIVIADYEDLYGDEITAPPDRNNSGGRLGDLAQRDCKALKRIIEELQ